MYRHWHGRVRAALGPSLCDGCRGPHSQALFIVWPRLRQYSERSWAFSRWSQPPPRTCPGRSSFPGPQGRCPGSSDLVPGPPDVTFRWSARRCSPAQPTAHRQAVRRQQRRQHRLFALVTVSRHDSLSPSAPLDVRGYKIEATTSLIVGAATAHNAC